MPGALFLLVQNKAKYELKTVGDKLDQHSSKHYSAN